ncbi:MAG: hypothetical protein HY278_03480 [candidate division NC10 bacterium]|nr:hypothetical protein [candidate division NC10 bacterium]
MNLTTYDFRDENGDLLYQEVRKPDKGFYLRRPDGNGGWIHNLDGIRRVLYGLPELLNSTEPIIWVEGPKDVETLRKLGFTATTCANGANGWQDDFARYFKGRHLMVLRDNDAQGIKLRDQVVRGSRGYASQIVVLDLPGLPEKGDVTDWFQVGHGLEEFLDLLRQAERDQKVSASRKTEESRPTPSQPQAMLPPFPELAWVGPLKEWRDTLHGYIAHAEKPGPADTPLC